MAQSHTITIKTLYGLERVLAQEVKALGGGDVEVLKRAVSVSGDLGFVYKCNLWLRTALRVLMQLKKFRARTPEELYEGVKSIPWEQHFAAQKTIAIDATVFSDHFPNSLFVAQKAKDAVADRFREKSGKRPSVNTQNPDIRINVHIVKGDVRISLDSSGDSLHKRKYRKVADRAPLSEVLAAGILLLSGWDQKSNLLDPMCGSGTILTEAALITHNIPPNVFRKEYAFQNWKNYDGELFNLIFDKALEKEQRFDGQLVGWDRNNTALRKARTNLKNALMADEVELETTDFLTQEPPSFSGPLTLILNPPYGEKIEADVEELYREIGRRLKFHYNGATAWIFTGSEEGIRNIGLRPSKKIQLYNGKIPCWLLRYDLYKGSRKEA